MPAPFDPERLLRVLGEHAIDFVLIGGLAAALHGSPTTTNDADICPSRERANLERLAAGTRALEARIRTEAVPEGLAFDCSADFFAAVDLVNLTTSAGDLDIAFRPSGGSGYEELAASAVRYDIAGRAVQVASLDDVIHSKESADRPKDRAMLPVLRALRDELA